MYYTALCIAFTGLLFGLLDIVKFKRLGGYHLASMAVLDFFIFATTWTSFRSHELSTFMQIAVLLSTTGVTILCLSLIFDSPKKRERRRTPGTFRDKSESLPNDDRRRPWLGKGRPNQVDTLNMYDRAE